MNNNQAQVIFNVPNGMIIMPHILPGQWILMFAHADVEAARKFTQELADNVGKVTVTIQQHVLAPKRVSKCSHPENKRHFGDQGVLCLQCNEPILTPLENTGFSAHETAVALPSPPSKPTKEVEPVADTEPPPAIEETAPPKYRVIVRSEVHGDQLVKETDVKSEAQAVHDSMKSAVTNPNFQVILIENP